MEPELRKMTKEEQEKYNKKTARKTGFIIRLIRICKNNKDIIWLSILTISLIFAGYFLAKVIANITDKEIIYGLWDFGKFIFASIVAITAFLLKLFAKKGTLSMKMSSSEIVEKARNNIDLVLVFAVGITMLASGYFLARFYFHLSITELKTTIIEFFEFLFVFIVALSTFIAKLCAKQGDLSCKMSERVEKTEVSGDGRSII